MDKHIYRHLITCRKDVIKNLKNDIEVHKIGVDLSLIDDLDNDTIIGISYLNQGIMGGIIVPDYDATFKASSSFAPTSLYNFKGSLEDSDIPINEEIIRFHERCSILVLTMDKEIALMLKMKYY